MRMAEVEGLTAHGGSVQLRLRNQGFSGRMRRGGFAMIANIDPAQESDVLLMLDLLAPDNAVLPPDVAQWLLSIKFSEEQRTRMLDLADRGNQGTLTMEQRDEHAPLRSRR